MLPLNAKVKMKLVQPAIICSGRKEVVCYYRGVVTGVSKNLRRIQFKRYGETVEHWYDTITKEFVDEELKDVQIL